jgi:hypothetical protein
MKNTRLGIDLIKSVKGKYIVVSRSAQIMCSGITASTGAHHWFSELKTGHKTYYYLRKQGLTRTTG